MSTLLYPTRNGKKITRRRTAMLPDAANTLSYNETLNELEAIIKNAETRQRKERATAD